MRASWGAAFSTGRHARPAQPFSVNLAGTRSQCKSSVCKQAYLDAFARPPPVVCTVVLLHVFSVMLLAFRAPLQLEFLLL